MGVSAAHPAPGASRVAAAATDRLDLLRRELRRRRLAGFVVPRADAHQGEYVAPSDERLRWLTGFTGSAGTAVVFADAAALFVDGRYVVQAKEEVDADRFRICHLVRQPPGEFIAETLQRRGRLGFDPWLHTPAQVKSLQAAVARAGGRLVSVVDNPIDRLWTDRPSPPLAPLFVHDAAFAGDTAADKRARIAEDLRVRAEDAAVLAQPDSVAWLLNVRGGDVPYSPLPLVFAVIAADGGVALVCDARKLTPAVIEHLGEGVRVVEPAAIGELLDSLGVAGARVRVDADGTPEWIVRRLTSAGAVLSFGSDPCQLPKATKTAAEQAGFRAAHRRDGGALVRFFAWLATAAPLGEVSEMTAADRLAGFRADGEHYRGPSFPTISAAAASGAVVHYRASERSDRRLAADTLYLVDSGGQYLDGTTDVTRTVAIGTPSDEMRRRFTQVLKGHIALASAVFPRGTTGSQLDALARMALWRAGVDYDHGTGHGVGAFLGVHEGPQRISKLPNRVALEVGMVVSNEPGYYKEGAFGIRIENLVMVEPAPAPPGAELELLRLETLTLAPIDRALIDSALLTPDEVAWVDEYHARVRDTLSGQLDAVTAAWLAAATAPLATAGWSGER
ncbi:MAG: aminopeptidase P family protein [Rhodospirillales bacterium]